ncbi:hypothetical protein VN24_20390 [Paenibacillus beijingensis]|uniref:Uncharacterized protein n=1 Tax=Paenibacillus beijingensis TaxID=1126833 RepID=A0A0D5NMI8_9BACL|nr:hypothetical protein VN24_20390 [Paenibacillus beijingensis]
MSGSLGNFAERKAIPLSTGDLIWIMPAETIRHVVNDSKMAATQFRGHFSSICLPVSGADAVLRPPLQAF